MKEKKMNEPAIKEEFSVTNFDNLDDWLNNFIIPQQNDFKNFTSNIPNSTSKIENQSTSNTTATQSNFESTLPTITTTISSLNSILQIQTTIGTRDSSSSDEEEEILSNTNLKSNLFNKMYFLLVGTLSKDQSYLKGLIEENGGSVCKNYSLSKLPIVLVNNNFNWNSSFVKSIKFQTVLNLKVPIYNENFLFDCTAAKCVLDLNDYLVPNKSSPQKRSMNEERDNRPKKVKFTCCDFLSNGVECLLEVDFEKERCDCCHHCFENGERCYEEIENGKYCSLHS